VSERGRGVARARQKCYTLRVYAPTTGSVDRESVLELSCCRCDPNENDKGGSIN